jgi:hypothetical protein
MSVPQEDPVESAVARLNEVINKAQENSTTLAQKVRDAPDPLREQRDWIGKVIIGVFACALLLGFVTLVLEGFRGQPDGQIWKEVATQATDLIKSAVLPIVTLVLGYYFGQSTRT